MVYCRQQRRFGEIVAVLLAFLAACSSTAAPQSAAELPTVAQLPTVTASATIPPESPTNTPVNETSTELPTSTIIPSATLTFTPSETITDTPTPTPSDTPTATETPIPTADNEGVMALVGLAAQATVIPQLAQPLAPTVPGVVPLPTASCTSLPSGGFGMVVSNNPALVQQLGCVVGVPAVTILLSSADQVYERGEMVWLQGPPAVIYALFNTGRFQRYDDTFNAATDPVSGGETPPAGLKEPVRGFGKVWRAFPEVRTGLGWAVNDESGGQAVVQLFERGQMAYLPQRGMIYILVNDPGGLTGTWQAVAGSY
jgi:hypothetical protein